MGELSAGRELPAPAVVLRDLSMTFPGRRGELPVRVLGGIDLEVKQGEFICIVGPSGCGKSTVLNIVGGYQCPTAGLVLVGGEPVRGPDRRRLFVFQDSGLFPWLTVKDNIGFGLGHKSKGEQKEIIQRYVAMVGLTGFEEAYPHELSGGMRQRVELARALAADPETLFMDEPFGSLDYLTRLKMRADLESIWQQERKTILLVTHDIDEAIQLSDRVVVLGERPATVREVIDIPLLRPRDPLGQVSLQIRARMLAILGLDTS